MRRLHTPNKWRNTKLSFLIIAKIVLAVVFILWLWLVFIGVPKSIISKFKLQAEQKLNIKIEIGGLKMHYHLGGWHAQDVHLLIPYQEDFTIAVAVDDISWRGRWLSQIDFNKKAQLKLEKTSVDLSQNATSKTWELAQELDVNLFWDIAQDRFELELQKGQVLGIYSQKILLSGGVQDFLNKDNAEMQHHSQAGRSGQAMTTTLNLLRQQEQSDKLLETLELYETYLKKWQLDKKEMSLQLQLEILSLNQAQFTAQGTLVAQDWLFHDESLFSKGYCQFSWDGRTLAIAQIEIQHNQQLLTAQGNFDVVEKSLNLQMQSNVGVLAYVDDLLEDKSPWSIKDIEQEKIELSLTANWDNFAKLVPAHYNVKGSVALDGGFIDDLYFDSLNAQFHFKDNQGILQDLTLVAKDKQGVLNYLRDGEKAKYSMDSTLDFAWSKLLIKPFSFKKYIEGFADTSESKIQLTLEGFSYLRENIWQTQLDLNAENIEYVGLNLSELQSSMVLSHDEALYRDVLLVLSPSDKKASEIYQEKTWHQFCNIEEVVFDRNTQIYMIKGLEGQIFPHLLVNSITQSSASYLADYQFDKPPYVTFNGSLGTDAGSNWVAQIKHDQQAKVKLGFLELPLEQVSARISRNQQELKVTNLQAKLWQGDLTGTAKVHLPSLTENQENIAWRSNIKADNIVAANLAKYFQFESSAEGLINGHLQLYNTSDQTQTLTGNGYIEYKEGALFSVPIFGPISTILSKMTGSKNMGYQQSTRSNATLSITNNNVYLQQLDLRTNSFKFEGEGVIGLESPNHAEIVISTETRGLLNILKYPLAPLTKFLTFKGSGALKDIQWGIAPLSDKKYAITTPVLPTMEEFSLHPLGDSNQTTKQNDNTISN